MYTALAAYGMTVVGVVVSRTHRGEKGSNPHMQALQRLLSWFIAWVLILGLSGVGYILLIVPGIYLYLRVIWADEFALVHRVNPLKALDESWQISRDQAGKTFGLEFALGFIGMFLAIPFVALYFGLQFILPDSHASDSLLAGAGMFMFLVFYAVVHSMQITFFYGLRAMRAGEAASADQKPMPKFLQWVSVPAGLLMLVLMGYGLVVGPGDLPSNRVLSGNMIPAEQIEVLLAEGIVYQDETVEYFFSEGIFSVREGGSVLTDRRVIAYETDEYNEVIIYEIYLEEIGSLELTQQGDASNFSIYQVNSHDGEWWLNLYLPYGYGDDKRFIGAVEAKIRK